MKISRQRITFMREGYDFWKDRMNNHMSI